MNNTCCVITTIHGPDHGSLREWARHWSDRDSVVIIVPDKKTPLDEWVHDKLLPDYSIEDVLIERQQALMNDRTPVVVVNPNLNIIDQSWAPHNHYARKNIGYLAALRLGFEYVFETDDDNYPVPGVEYTPFDSTYAVNGAAFNYMEWLDPGCGLIPRGLKLHMGYEPITYFEIPAAQPKPAIWSWACNGAPDLWAAQHMLMTKDIQFNWTKPNVALERGTYAPINSQHTLWHLPTMIRHMYLPFTCTMRECDILRGNFALHAAWTNFKTAAFTSRGVYQERNEHDYVADLHDEWRLMTRVNHTSSIRDLMDLGVLDETRELAYYKRYQDLVTEYGQLAKVKW